MSKRADDFQEQAEKYADDVWKEDEYIEQKCITMTDYFAGAEYGYQYAMQHPQWISVEERLPKRMNEKSRFSETVLVYNKEGYKDAAYYDYEEKIWRWMPMVTHWMEIVPPRKEANNER